MGFLSQTRAAYKDAHYVRCNLSRFPRFNGIRPIPASFFKIKKKVYIAYDKIIKHLINSKDKFEISIPIEYFRNNTIEIKRGLNPPLNLIEAINKKYNL